MRRQRFKVFLAIISIIFVILFLLSIDFYSPTPFSYGVSFSRFHADELQLDWKETYLAILNDLGVKKFRFSAHWPLTEPKEGVYNFEELDFQIEEARKKNAAVILALGRRLPGWPECHVPDWARTLDKEKQQEKILRFIETVVKRYKGFENIDYWQIENEPYLTFFSRAACGPLDEKFFIKEIEFVGQLDPRRPVIITDSGEFGTWFKAYKQADVFGTSIYLYIWNRVIGPFRYPIMPSFFRIKHNLIRLFYGPKPAFVIELSSEPWLLQPIVTTPLETQLTRMDIDKFNEMINFSAKTGFDTFYFWGAEWWYWMKKHGHDEFWNRAREVIQSNP